MFIKDRQGNILTGDRLEYVIKAGKAAAEAATKRLNDGHTPTTMELDRQRDSIKYAIQSAIDQFDAAAKPIDIGGKSGVG